MAQSVGATQADLNRMKDKFRGRVPIRVHFLDNSSKMFLVNAGTTVKLLLSMIAEKLDIHDHRRLAAYFGIFESLDGSNFERCLPAEEKIDEIANGFGDNQRARLVFMIKLHMDSLFPFDSREEVGNRVGKSAQELTKEEYFDKAIVRDEALLRICYIQSVFDVITSQFHVATQEALSLAGLQFVAKFGPVDPARHTPGFLGSSIAEFIPRHLIRNKRRDQWERDVLDAAAAVGDLSNVNGGAKQKYVGAVYGFDHNIGGTVFFHCKQYQFSKLSEDSFLGISQRGIAVFSSSKQFHSSYGLEQIFRWGYRPGTSFYFEANIPQSGKTTFEFDMETGQSVSDLLTDYAMAIVAERQAAQRMAAAAQAAAEEKAAMAAASTVSSRATGVASASNGSNFASGLPENIQGKSVAAPVNDDEVHANVSEMTSGDMTAEQGRRRGDDDN